MSATGQVPTLVAIPSPATCRRDAANGIQCYRVVFDDFRTVDVAAFRARIGASIISSFEIVIRDQKLIVYVCVKIPRTAARSASDVCDPAASECENFLRVTASSAAKIFMSFAILLACLFLLA